MYKEYIGFLSLIKCGPVLCIVTHVTLWLGTVHANKDNICDCKHSECIFSR